MGMGSVLIYNPFWFLVLFRDEQIVGWINVLASQSAVEFFILIDLSIVEIWSYILTREQRTGAI